MADLGLNALTWVNPNMGHPSDADLEMAASAAETDSPWLHEWSRLGGMNNYLWASGLEHLVYNGMVLDSTGGVGVAVMDQFGWRGTVILSQCGHPVVFHSSDEYVYKYVNELPFECGYCKKWAKRIGTN